VYSTPDRRHGYTTDDNARAVIVAAMVWSHFQDERVLAPLQTYLAFLNHARPGGGGRFRNLMSYDRCWLETDWSDDCQGRVQWALGYLIAHAPHKSIRLLAEDLFRLSLATSSAWRVRVRGRSPFWACITTSGSSRTIRRLAPVLIRRSPSVWRPPSKSMRPPTGRGVKTWSRMRTPACPKRSSWRVWRWTMRSLTQRGLRVLTWLLDVQTADDGHLSVIGSDGWLRRGGRRAPYDQQPVEAAALIDACKAAHRATGEEKWLIEMRRCFAWYLGQNDAGVSLIEFKSHGCHDGLGPRRSQPELRRRILPLLAAIVIDDARDAAR
jgi:hypothetical protein